MSKVKRTGGRPPGRPQLDRLHRMQAKELAGELVGRGIPRRDLVRYLLEWAKGETVNLGHLLTEGVAETIVAELFAELAQARWPNREAVARELDVQLQELHRQAVEAKQFNAARGAIDSRARLHRVYTNEASTPAENPADEFAQRSADDNAFYAEHGCWPEEYKQPVKRAPVDPLEKLAAKLH